MVDDYGLIGGIGQGIQKGLLMYQQQKQLQRENQIQNLTSGVESDADGNLQLTPQAQLHKQAQASSDQNAIDANTMGSDLSKSATATYKQSLESSKPGSSAGIPDMTYNQVKDTGIPLAKPQISGQMGLLGKQVTAEQSGANAQTGADARIKSAQIGATAQQNKSQYQQQRLAYQSDKEARATGNNDAILKMYSQRLEGAAKIKELIDAAKSGKVVSNNALLGQLNAEVGRLETGSQSPGLGAGEKTELLDKKAQIQGVIDSFTGNPQDAVSPEVMNTTGKMVNELSGSYTRGIDSRMEFLKGGMTPSQTQIMNQKQQSMKNTYQPRIGAWNEQSAPQQGPSMLGGAQPQSSGMIGQQGQFAPDVLNYAQTHNITPQEAQNVKNARGGR